jgi:hypothetical protein
MKTLMMFAALAALSTSAASASAVNGEGYNKRLEESRRPSYNGEYVYLNSLRDFRGPGRLADCHRVTTYSGGPKSPFLRTYYVCRVTQ